MSTTEARGNDATAAGVATVDMNLEVVIPVSDVDRAKQFYESLGWRLDAGFGSGNARGMQMTPEGSGCSIQFGGIVPSPPPGSAQGLHVIVSDIEAANEELVAHGVHTSGVFHCASGYAWNPGTRADSRATTHRPPARTPTMAPTGRSSPSAILTATAGWCRK